MRIESPQVLPRAYLFHELNHSLLGHIDHSVFRSFVDCPVLLLVDEDVRLKTSKSQNFLPQYLKNLAYLTFVNFIDIM